MRGEEPERILTEAECIALAEQIFRLQRGGGETQVRILSYWGGTLRWGRNRVTLASDRQEPRVDVDRRIHGAGAHVGTNQLDPAALEAAVRAAERKLRQEDRTDEPDDLRAPVRFAPPLPKPAIWSEATYHLTANARGDVARTLIAPVEAAGLLSAGYLAAEAQAYAVITTQGHRLYARMTQGRCAMTVRDPAGTGSGWAGQSSYDWATIDGPALARRALRKCVESRNPVALEPGRYTVILEPQAVADLLSLLIELNELPGVNDRPFGRVRAEDDTPWPPFWQRPYFSKLGLKVADERVTIGQDPLDPELGALPFAEESEEPGDPYRAVNWIERGVLTALPYSREYALARLHENLALPNQWAFRMQGGPTSVTEMIATTKRGLLVTRFSNLRVLNQGSLLSTGLTRDGLWLIENGKITKAVKNFRFVDSPLFALNNLEQLGPAEPVFRPGPWGQNSSLLRPAVVPPLKVRDFSFTALVDAV